LRYGSRNYISYSPCSEGTSKTVFENGEMFESKIITKNGIEIGGLADAVIAAKTKIISL